MLRGLRIPWKEKIPRRYLITRMAAVWGSTAQSIIPLRMRNSSLKKARAARMRL